MTKMKITEKLAKLIRHEKSARDVGNFEEAEAFAGKVNELLLRHKITMSEVDLASLDEDDEMGQSTWRPWEHDIRYKLRRIRWMQILARITAKAHFCRILVMSGSNTLFFIGRESDRTVTSYVYTYLVKQIHFHAEREYCRAYAENDRVNGRGERWRMRGYKASWIEGVLSSLQKRFKEMRGDIEVEVGSIGTALIHLADNAVQEYYATLKVRKGTGFQAPNLYNPEGYTDGKEWGKGVEIRRGVDAGPTRGRIK